MFAVVFRSYEGGWLCAKFKRDVDFRELVGENTLILSLLR